MFSKQLTIIPLTALYTHVPVEEQLNDIITAFMHDFMSASSQHSSKPQG